MFEIPFTIITSVIIVMAGVTMLGIIIHIGTLPFLFAWAVMHRRGGAFLNANPVLILLALPMTLFVLGSLL